MKRKNDKSTFVGFFIWSPILLLILIAPGGFNLIVKIIIGAILVFTIIVITALLKKKNKQKGFNEIETEYLKNPDNLNKFIELGYAALSTKDHDRARSIFNKITSQFPKRPAGYCGLGIIEFDKKNYKQAKMYFEETIKLDSSYDIAKQKLEYIFQNDLS